MPLVEDVARAALAAVDTDAGIMRGIKWTIDRYEELASRVKLKQLRRVGELTLPAPITAGLATVTSGSTLVTGDATALAAWAAEAITGRYFRGSVNYYKIADVEPTGLRLESPWSESPTGALSYRVIARFVPLAADVRWPGVMVHMRRRKPLDWITPEEIDLAVAPARESTSAGPHYAVDRGLDVATGRRLVEFYPYPNQAEQVVYTYTAKPPSMGADTPLPDVVTVAHMKTGVLVDVYRYEMAKSIRAGQIEAAAVWRNEARAQRTEWEKAIDDLINLDRGADDFTLILRLRQSGSPGVGVYDAHTDVYARWRGW